MESFEKNSRDLFECHWIGCGQEFQYLSGLKRHLLVHKKPFNCPKCEKTFAQKSNLKDHYLRIHCDNESIDNNNSNLIINNNQNQNSSQNVSQKRVNKRAIQRNSEGFYPCEWCGCGQQFQYLSGLSRHTMIHKGLKPFKCPKCDRSFAQKSNMREHYLRIHRNNEGLNQIMKSICRKYSNKSLNKSSFNQFIHNGEVYVCQWFGCELKFLSFSGIRRHLLTHRGIKPFKCLSTDCERSFAQKSNMISHYNRIHSSSLDENEVSNQSISNNNNNNLMGYENQMIAKNITNFNRDKNIKSKVRRIRSKEKPINRRTNTGFYCSHSSCNQLFNSIKSLELHEKAIHDINNPIECTFNGCNARLKSKASLEQHLKRHKTEFRCDYNECDYRTHLEHSYRYHMSKHSGQELYTCDSCDHCFTFLGALNSHMKSVHSIATPLMCEWPGCESKFGTVRGLRKHKTLHTGEKPYSCSWPACGLEFRFLSSLKTHLSSHTGLKPFKCQECDRVFAQKAYLKFHYKRIHCK